MRRYFDRSQIEHLAGPFCEWPALICPECERSSLEPTVNTFLSRESKIVRDDEFGEPTSSDGYFHGALNCPRSPCGNSYVVAGRWKVDYVEGVRETPGDELYTDYYWLNYVMPSLPLMDYPGDVPEEVREPISSASLVLLSDASAAANRIRSAIEVLLDYQRIRKFRQGSRSDRLRTHARIKEFEGKNPDAAAHLMAMKWIGNIGSHERNPLPLAWVLDGLEHFARALELIYDPHEKELERRAAAINRKGGKMRPPRSTQV
jgi:hypothetical protein